MNETAAHIIRFESLSPQKWRNGGGTTVEIARSSTTAAPGSAAPPPAPETDWQWRISIAEVAKAGDFSAFPGCERILTVIDGEFMLLTVDGVDRGLQRYRPFRFDGEAPTSATLPEGPIRDLNVITGPGHRGHVVIVELSKQRPQPVFGAQFAVLLHGKAFVAPGAAGPADAAVAQEADQRLPLGGAVAPQPGPVALEHLDTVIGIDDAPPHISGRGYLAVISIDPR